MIIESRARSLLRWNLAFCLALSACSNPLSRATLDQAKFEAVHRAGRDVREHTATGVALIAYRDLVGKYATEVSLARDKAASDLEKAFVGNHQRALTAYRDAATIWTLKLQGREFAHMGDEGYQRVVDDYSVPGTGTGVEHVFKIDDAIQIIWGKADAILKAADDIYLGQTSETK